MRKELVAVLAVVVALGIVGLVALVALGSGQAPEVPIAAPPPSTSTVASPPKPRPKPRVTVRRPSAPAPEEPAPEQPALVELKYGELSATEKTALSMSQNQVGAVVGTACLAGALARTGRTEPMTVELEVSTTSAGLHDVEVVYDEEADAEAVACLEEAFWRISWPSLARDGVITQSVSMQVDPKVRPVPLDEALAQAEAILAATMPAAEDEP